MLTVVAAVLCTGALYSQDDDYFNKKVIVTMRDGDRISGRVLFARDSILVLWQSEQPYSASSLPFLGKALQSSDMRLISVVNENDFWSAVGGGALIGFAGGTAVGGAVVGIFDSTTFAQKVGVALTVGVIVAIPAALYFGIREAIVGIDDDYIVNGDINKYRQHLPIVMRCAMLTAPPPPELEAFINANQSRQ